VVEVSPGLLKEPESLALTAAPAPGEGTLLKQITMELVGKDPGDPAKPRPYSITATRLNTELGLCRAASFVLDRNEIALNPDGTLTQAAVVTVTLLNRPDTPFNDVERNCRRSSTSSSPRVR